MWEKVNGSQMANVEPWLAGWPQKNLHLGWYVKNKIQSLGLHFWTV